MAVTKELVQCALSLVGTVGGLSMCAAGPFEDNEALYLSWGWSGTTLTAAAFGTVTWRKGATPHA